MNSPFNRLLRPLALIAWLHAARQALALLLMPVLLWLIVGLFRDLAALAGTAGW
jgi:hypothetical protein